MTDLRDVFDTPDPVAVVTGSGAPRVGRVIAEELSRRGCHVLLHAHGDAAEADTVAADWPGRFGRQAAVFTGDLADDQTCDSMIRQAVELWGRLDVLVNSAAIWHPTPLADVTAEEIRQYFQINTVAPWLLSRAAAGVMRRQPGGGSIVNISDWATTRPYLDHAAYFPSKGAVESMSRSLAVEFASLHPGIRVNCIRPGPVLLGDGIDELTVQKLIDSTLVGRLGTPDDIARAVAMLCENTFITGVCLNVDGGRSIYANDQLQRGGNTG